MDIVEQVFDKTDKKCSSIEVDKVINVDLGCLMAEDQNELDLNALRDDPDDYIKQLSRNNCQYLINEIWKLETERVEEVIVAVLPKPRFRLPRARPVPKPKGLTKWERFAKLKGIEKKKKPKLSWDDQLKKWVPRYGFKRAQAEKEKDWVLEVPQNADPMEDQFEKKNVAKSEKVAKNELQRLRNIAKAKNIKVPKFGVTSSDVSSSKELQAAVTIARSSTASLGKFQQKLPKEKEARGIADITPGASRKRKLPPISLSEEKKQSLDIVDSVLNKRPKLNVEKVVLKRTQEQQSQPMRERKRKQQKANNAGKKKPKNSNKARKGKVSGGRKRR